MKVKTKLTIILAGLLLLGACGTCEPPKGNEVPLSIRLQKVSNCTWMVLRRADNGLGSGVHIGNGRILTAAHVIREEPELDLILGDLELTAKVIKRDDILDLAILQIQEDYKNLPYLEIAKSGVKLGEAIRSSGYHFGYPNGQAVSPGVVTGSCWMQAGEIQVQFIFHNAASNPGCSGGPVLNKDFQVIGVNQRILNEYMPIFAGVSMTGSLDALKEFLKEK